MWESMKRRTTKDKEAMNLDSKEFYFFQGVVYQDPRTLPTLEYYPIFSKGRQIPGQAMGCLKVPGYGVN